MVVATSASSSPRKSGTLYPPYEGTTVRQNEMRQRIRVDHFDDFMKCAPKVFLRGFASNKGLRSKYLVEAVTESLKSRCLLDNDGWIPLRDEKARSENETFAFLGKVAQAIVSAVGDYDETLKPKAEAQPSLHATSSHAKAGYKFFPDLRAVVSSSIGINPKPSHHRGKAMGGSDWVDTSDISAIGEFQLKPNSEDNCNNEEKLVGAANQLLWNDPCRERVLGFTVEDRRTRFWDFSRSGITVSEPFNLDNKPRLFIKFLLFIIFGNKHEVGFDPTVQSVVVNGEMRYCYQIGDNYYLTVGPPLSEEAAYRMVGRATRVWVVISLLPHTDGDTDVQGKKFRQLSARRVLKDVWLYEEALLERQLQQAILDKLDGHRKRKLKRHFLTFIAEEVVTFEGKERRTRRCKVEQANWYKNSYSHQGPTRENPLRLETELTKIPRVHTRRKHVRSLVKEECQSLYQLTDFMDALSCWKDMITCLDLFRQAGFIHRDLSGGNTLFFKQRGIISDLEYCKMYEDTSVHDPKMGTPDFMAAEYQKNTFFFPPYPTDETKATFKFEREWFTVHFVHDLESVYWQYLWFLHNRIPVDPVDKLSFKSLEEVQQEAKRYFGHSINGNDDRSGVIQRPGRELAIETHLETVHSPDHLAPISFANNLRDEYTRLLRTPPTKIGGAWRLRDVFNKEIYQKFLSVIQLALSKTPSPCPVVSIEVAAAGANEGQGGVAMIVDAPSNKKRKLQPPEHDSQPPSKKMHVQM